MKRLGPDALLASLFLSGACADSENPTTLPDPLPEGGLSLVEATVLAELFTGEALGSTEGQLPGGAAAAAGAPVPFDLELAVTTPCPLGGEVAFQGSVAGELDVESGSLSVTFTASQVHASCAVDADGTTVTVSGNPGLNLTSQLTVAGDPPQGTQTATLTGGFTWSASDGREGACDIDVSTTVDVGSETGTGSASGTVCGHSLDITVG